MQPHPESDYNLEPIKGTSILSRYVNQVTLSNAAEKFLFNILKFDDVIIFGLINCSCNK
jgi:hypothetical protein